MKKLSQILLILFLMFVAVVPLFAGLTAHDVLVVVNDQSPVSIAIADYYQSVRGIPDVNVCHLTNCPTSEWISPEQWYDYIRTPIWDYLNDSSHPWLKDQVKTIVLTKGVPIGFWADAERTASVDMPLCYLGNTSSAGTEPTGNFYLSPGSHTSINNAYVGLNETFELFRADTANANKRSTAFPNILDVCRFDGNTVIVAGNNGLLARFDGTSWASVIDRARSFSGSPMTCLAHVGDTGWVTEVNGRILKSTDNGANWSCVRGSSTGTTLNSVSFADANNGWAVGGENWTPLILHTESGGSWGTWTPVDPAFMGSATLNGVCATGTNGAVVCGSNGVILTWTWPANIWTIAEDIPNVSYNGVALVPSGDTYAGWVVGDNGTILKTTDSGTTWQQQTSLFTGSLKKVFVLDTDHAWITTGTNTLLRTTNGGTTWDVLTLATGQELTAVSFASSYSGFGVSGKTVLSTSDGGATWFPVFTGEDTTWHVNYLLCRLDSYQEPANADGLPFDVKRMIDDASSPDSAGQFVLDQRSPQSGDDQGWMNEAHSTLTSMGVQSTLDTTYEFVTDSSDVMGYCSWGSNDWASRYDTEWSKPRNSWRKGSISTLYVSTSGRSLNYPPDYMTCAPTFKEISPNLQGKLRIQGAWQNWYGLLHDNSTGETTVTAPCTNGYIDFVLPHSISDGYIQLYSPNGQPVENARLIATTSAPFVRNQLYDFGRQTMAADLLREGCDATIGNVTEPWFGACGQPRYMFPRYVSGYTWAEVSYMALATGAWMELVLGDPLMAAYATPPAVALTSPNTDGAVISGTDYTVTATATPNNAAGINRVEFWLTDGQNVDALIGTDTSEPYSITFDTTTLPAPYSQAIADGRYILEAIAYEDTNVREVGSARRPIVIDNGGSPTTVDITSPSTDGTTLSNTATITVSANPSAPPSTATVDLWLHAPGRDQLLGSIASAPFNFQFDTTAIPDGSYVLQAVAYSSTGQASASTVRHVNVDNTDLIEITTPSTDGQVKSGVFITEATVNGAASVSRVEFWLGQGVNPGMLLTSDTTSPYTYDIDSTAFADGDYIIRAMAYTSGTSPAVNVAKRTVTFSNSSLLTFTLPATDGQQVSGNLSVQVTAGSSTPPVTQVDLWPYGVADWVVTSTDSTSPFNWTIDTTTIPNGTYGMRADGIKQGGAHIIEHPVRTIAVNNPNLLSITQPATDGTTVSENTTIVVGAQSTTPDYGSIKIFFSGESEPWTITSRPFKYTFNTQDYPNGIYTVTAYAYKPDGRLVASSSATRTIIISNQYVRCAAINNARSLEDGSGVLLEGKTVTAGMGGPMDGTFYIQEPSELSGLRIVTTGSTQISGGSTVATGKTVTVMGIIGNNTNTGERQVTADAVYISGDATPIQPMGMINRSVGGAPLSNEPYTNGITDGVGVYNVGLLIRIFGYVTYVGTDCYYINDGTNIQDGNIRSAPALVPLNGDPVPAATSPKGLKVYCGTLAKPLLDDYVAVTGISSMFKIGDNRVRCIRMRNHTGSGENPDLTIVDSYSASYTKAAKQPLWSWFDWQTSNPEHPFIGQFVDSTLAHVTTGNKIRMTGAIVESQTGTGSDAMLTFRHYDPTIHRSMSGENPVRTGKLLINEAKSMWWPVFAQAYTGLNKYDAITVLGTTAVHTGYTLDSVTDEWIIPDRIYKYYPDGSTSGESMMMSMGGGEDTTLLTAEGVEVTPVVSAVPGESEPGGGEIGPATTYDDSSILQADWFKAADSQTGAIGWALAKKDGDVVSLPGEHVVQVQDGGQTLAIKEWFEPGVPSPRLVLKLGTAVQGLDTNVPITIDIVGATLTTLPDGKRALINPQAVYLYTDEDGNIAPPIPPGKEFGSTLATWQWKRLIAP